MKVYIGPYTDWIGPVQIAEKILFWKDRYAINKDNVDEDHPDSVAIYKLADILGKIPGLRKFCEWNYQRQKRKIDIQIDNYDVWNADDTLALIITPVLKKLKEQKHGYPFVDLGDVPEHVRTLSDSERWDWVLNEMIWAFEQHSTDWEAQFYSGDPDIRFEKEPDTGYSTMVRGPNDTFKVDKEGMNNAYKRMENGRILFAKYYQSLWD